jgi:hypothetical protein
MCTEHLPSVFLCERSFPYTREAKSQRNDADTCLHIFQPRYVYKIRTILWNIDKLPGYLKTIAETFFIPAACFIAEIPVAGEIQVLFFVKIDPSMRI